MFGMGGTEILVILIVALLFLGPDKLPEAAKQISKGIRDIKKQSRMLQQTIEDDEHIGGAIRDLKSALRGEDVPVRPRPNQPPRQLEASPTPDPALPGSPAVAALAASAGSADAGDPASSEISGEGAAEAHAAGQAEAAKAAPVGDHGTGAGADAPRLTLPPTAGEPAPSDEAAPAPSTHDGADLAMLVKPAPNTIARGAALSGPTEPPEPEHG